MPEYKLQKFVRSEATTGHLRIQHRDIALLQSLASFRFLNSAQIMALHPGGKRNLQRRLHRLYHLGYLERPEAQREIVLASNNLVYALGKKYLRERKELEEEYIERHNKLTRVDEPDTFKETKG